MNRYSPSRPIDLALYEETKADAKAKFKVYPSIYANAWLVREYKRRGGRYAGLKRNSSSSILADESGWRAVDERDALRIEHSDYDRVVPIVIKAKTGALYALGIHINDHANVDWVLRAPDGIIAGFGSLEETADGYGVVYARFRPEHRRKGLYTQVLTALRATVGPIRSDWFQTAGAERAWQKLGAEFVPEHGGKPGYYKLNPGLRQWFNERWVDLARPLSHGGWAECGRPSAQGPGWRKQYPKCVPLARAKSMTKAQIRSAVRRKRKAMSKAKRGKPTYVRTLKRNAGVPWTTWLLVGAGAVAAAYLVRELVQKPVDAARGVTSP